MQEQELQNTLAAVHEQLSERTQVDDQTRTLLMTLASDIHRLLNVAEASPTPEEGALSDQVQGVMRKFEADHPELTDALNRIASSLANMGI